MKQFCLAVGLLAGLSGACGGGDETALASEIEEAAPSTATLIDRVQWNGETIGFYDASSAEDGVPAIIVSQSGDNDAPELETWLGNRARYPITPAELWREATGEDDVPRELLEHHAFQAEAGGRPNADLQDFDGEVEKAGFPNVSQMFPLDPNSTGTTTGTHCWADGGIRAVLTGPGTPSNAYSTCSSNGTFIRSFAIDGECNAILNQNTTVRTQAYNGSAFTLFSKFCFATGTGLWTCDREVSVPFNNYTGASFYKNGSKHRLGSGIRVPTDQPLIQHNAFYLATATLQDTLHRFEDSGCTAFTENFRRP